jgi:hypothetical protein
MNDDNTLNFVVSLVLSHEQVYNHLFQAIRAALEAKIERTKNSMDALSDCRPEFFGVPAKLALDDSKSNILGLANKKPTPSTPYYASIQHLK